MHSKTLTWIVTSFTYLTSCIFLACRRYLKSQDDLEEDLPGLEEDAGPDLEFTVLRRTTMAAAAERRLQNQQDPAV